MFFRHCEKSTLPVLRFSSSKMSTSLIFRLMLPTFSRACHFNYHPYPIYFLSLSLSQHSNLASHFPPLSLAASQHASRRRRHWRLPRHWHWSGWSVGQADRRAAGPVGVGAACHVRGAVSSLGRERCSQKFSIEPLLIVFVKAFIAMRNMGSKFGDFIFALFKKNVENISSQLFLSPPDCL